MEAGPWTRRSEISVLSHFLGASVRGLVLLLFLLLLPSQAGAQYLKKANTLYNQGKYARAIATYKKAVAKGENPTLCYFNLANTYFQTAELSRAIVYYRASIDAAPDFFMSHLNLAVTYYMLDEIGDAIALLKRALELKPGHLKASTMLAASYRRAGDLPRAATLFERIYEKHPDQHKVCLSLGEIYREMDDPHEAEKWLLRYPQSGKHRLSVLQMLAEIHEREGNLDKAIYYLRQVAGADRKNRWAHYQFVILLNRTGHALVALEEAEKGMELYRAFAEMALFAGNVAFEQKLYSRAEEHYKRAVKLGNPGAVVGLENIRTIRENAK